MTKREVENYARLCQQLGNLGFSREEIDQLIRIERTLTNWSTAECNGDIERDEVTGKPRQVSRAYVLGHGEYHSWPIADREAGALRRLRAIVFARNARARGVDEALTSNPFMAKPDKRDVHAYHQRDPRGCSLYLVPASALTNVTDEDIIRHSGPSAVKSAESRLRWALSCYYTRGIAVCY